VQNTKAVQIIPNKKATDTLEVGLWFWREIQISFELIYGSMPTEGKKQVELKKTKIEDKDAQVWQIRFTNEVFKRYKCVRDLTVYNYYFAAC